MPTESMIITLNIGIFEDLWEGGRRGGVGGEQSEGRYLDYYKSFFKFGEQ